MKSDIFKIADKNSTIAFGTNISNIGAKMAYTENAERDFQDLPKFLIKHLDGILHFRANDTHAVVTLDQNVENKFSKVLTAFNPEIRIMSHGSSLEIYKEVGLPEQVTQRFHITQMSGRHGIGHTRMASVSPGTTF